MTIMMKEAYMLIIGALSDKVYQDTRVDSGNPFDVWKKLKGFYDRETGVSLQGYFRRLHNMSMSDDETFNSYAARVTGSSNSLEKLCRSHFKFVLLAGLHPRYAAKVAIIEDKKDMSLEDVEQVLRDFDVSHPTTDSSTTDGSTRVFTAQESKTEVCRNFIKGRCKWGSKCH